MRGERLDSEVTRRKRAGWFGHDSSVGLGVVVMCVRYGSMAACLPMAEMGNGVSGRGV
jgi:hypothetical protein